MNDTLMRESFHRQVLRRHHTSPNTLVLNELGLRHGTCRADIAIINGSLTGYEIKSDEDSLERLAEQIKTYSAVFDRAAVITGKKHKNAVLSRLPKWWGVIVCHRGRRGGVRFETWRIARRNAHVDPIAVAQLLWKAEAAGILKDLGEPSSTLRQRRSLLYERLVAVMGLAQLQHRVRECLKRRRNWRHPEPPSPSGD
jgi:hypothetical protein